jgi:methylated-DNA-[protein]-cysteine S-methyltransferase
MECVFKVMRSPIGELTLVGSDRGLAEVLWRGERSNRRRLATMKEDPNHPLLIEAERQLSEYFARKRKRFALKLDFRGTEFQLRVWSELLKIPFGETRTYGDVAKRLGDAKATRAVGAANGRNPIPIIAPCHRVIGASGELIGFGGGLDVKAYLLDLERGTIEFDFAKERD